MENNLKCDSGSLLMAPYRVVYGDERRGTGLGSCGTLEKALAVASQHEGTYVLHGPTLKAWNADGSVRWEGV